MKTRTLKEALLQEACGFRCGIVSPVELAEGTLADLPGFYNAVVATEERSPGEASNGGIGRTPWQAYGSAVGESLERYASGAVTLPLRRLPELSGKAVLPSRAFDLFSPEQYSAPGFPWPAPDDGAETFAPVYSLADNEETWVTQELVGLGSRVDPPRIPSTSSGLASYTDRFTALLRGLQELLERDALTVYWLNSLPGRELSLPEEYLAPIASRGGEVRAFDFTQCWNPHPVVAVCGQIPLRGMKRISFGIACRGSYQEALESAYREWYQGVIFVAYYLNAHPELRLDRPSDVRDFIQHGVYYALQQEAWKKVPLLRPGAPPRPLPAERAPPRAPAQAMEELLSALSRQQIRLYYRDLSLPDVARLGVTVVRVLSPDLRLLHADEQTPFAGKRVREIAWRYPDLRPVLDAFPSPFPHPLG